MGRVTTSKIKDIAYKESDNGRCWWIERYIKNAYYNRFSNKSKRRR